MTTLARSTKDLDALETKQRVLEAKRLDLEGQLTMARQRFVEAEAEHERVSCEALIDGSEDARQRLELTDDGVADAGRQVRTLTHVLKALDRRLAKFGQDRQRAERRKMQSELATVAAEQQALGRRLDERFAEWCPNIREWLALATRCHQLRAALGHSSGRTSYARFNDAFLSWAHQVGVGLPSREYERLRRVLPSLKNPGTFRDQGFTASIGPISNADTPIRMASPNEQADTEGDDVIEVTLVEQEEDKLWRPH